MSNENTTDLQDEPFPVGSTSSTWYRRGYQQALIDIARKLDESGIADAMLWVEDNTTHQQVRDLVRQDRLS